MKFPRHRSRISPRLFSILLFPIIIAHSGCTRPSMIVLTNYERTYPTTNADSIRFTTEQKLSSPYTEVGYLYVQAPSLQAAIQESRERAAGSGGHMIIDMRAGVKVTQVGSVLFIPMYDTAFFLRGMVIRRIQ